MNRRSSNYISAAKRLRKKREMLGLSQTQLAERIGVNVARYRYWEKVFGPLPQRQYKDVLAKIFSVTPDWFICDEKEKSAIDEIDYAALGHRAATRRQVLKFSRDKVAKIVGVGNLTLRNWEVCLPVRPRIEKERLWEDALQVPDGWLRNLNVETPTINSTLDLTKASYSSVAEEIQAVGSWLARDAPSSRTSNFNELTGSEKRRVLIFAERFGCGGPEGSILQVIGDKYGLTRERVRQIVDGLMLRARGVTFVLPRFRQLQSVVGVSKAILVAEFESEHRELLGPSLALSGVDRFATEILGVKLAAFTERSFWQAGNAIQPMIVDEHGQELAVVVRNASRRMIRSCGAAHVMFVAGMASAALEEAVSVRDVRRILFAVEGMEWLVESEGWYWFGMDTANNRVLEVARKVLAVAGGRLDIEDLHQGVCRSRRMRYDEKVAPPSIEVPQNVLAEIFTRVPWLSVIQFDDFLLKEAISIEEALNSSELAVAKTILRHGGAVARFTLAKELVDTGMFSIPNLQIVLSSSPIIRALGFSIYGLRGVPVGDKAFSKAIASVGNGAASSIQQDLEGWYEFEFVVTEFKLKNGLYDFPMRIVKAIPKGVYRAEGAINGSFVIGATLSSPSRVTKLGPLFRKVGIRANEIVNVRIHSEKRVATFVRIDRSSAEV